MNSDGQLICLLNLCLGPQCLDNYLFVNTRFCRYGMARVTSSAIVYLVKSSKAYTTSSWVSRRVSIIGTSEDSALFPEVIFNDVIITQTRPMGGSEIRLKNVILSGSAYLGDARLVFESIVFRDFNLKSETQRRVKIYRSSVLIENSEVARSTFKIGPSVYNPSVPDGRMAYRNNDILPEMVDVTISFSNIVDSRFDIAGKVVDILIRQSKFTIQNGDFMTSYSPFLAVINMKQMMAQEKPGHGSGQLDSMAPRDDPVRPPRRRRSRIEIFDSNFKGFYKGRHISEAAMHIRAFAEVSVNIRNSIFEGNSRGLRIHADSSRQGNVEIVDSFFNGNSAIGPGGGLLFGQLSGSFSVKLHKNVFDSNSAQGLTDSLITESTSLSQITGSGGAIAIETKPSQSKEANNGPTRNILDISDSVFMNNTAESFGGSVYLTSDVDATLRNNTFSNTNIIRGMRARIGDILESRGRIVMSDNKFEAVSSEDTKPIISYRADRDTSFLVPQNLTFYCSPNYETKPVYDYIHSNVTTQVAMLLFYCKSCSREQYSLSGSTITMTSSPGTFTLDQTSEQKCQKCPYGANCVGPITAKPNYWGINVNNRVFMYVCPEDYCCQTGNCKSFDTCATNRVGILCGQCKPGYTESLFSTDCIIDSECGTSSWFWAIVVVYGLGYVLFFILQNELRILVWNFSHWIKKHRSRWQQKCCSRNRAHKWETESDAVTTSKHHTPQSTSSIDKNSAYLQIVMYYIQVASLLTTKIIYEDSRKEPLGGLQNFVQDTFSLSAIGISANTCLFTGVTPVLKTWIKSGFIFYLYLVWLLIYASAKCICRCNALPSISDTTIPLDSRFVVAFVNLMLYTYQYFAENSFNMLKCIRIESLPTLVLFVDGSEQCYQPWQYLVVAFACVYVFPYFIVLTVGPKLLKVRRISVKQFILSVIFPLFAAPFLVVFFIKNYHRSRGTSRLLRTQRTQIIHKEGGTVDAVVEVVAEPYRCDLAGGLCWEGMIALRRLVLVLIATLITQTLYRHLGLMLTNFLILVLHLRFEPFVSKSCNKIETISLGTLLLTSIMNLLKASYFESGEIPRGPANMIFLIWDWVEVLLLVAVPVFLLVIFVCALLLRLVALCIKICRRLNDQGNLGNNDEDLNQAYFYNRNGSEGSGNSGRNSMESPQSSSGLEANFFSPRHRSKRRMSAPPRRPFDEPSLRDGVDWPSWSDKSTIPITRDYNRFRGHNTNGFFYGPP